MAYLVVFWRKGVHNKLQDGFLWTKPLNLFADLVFSIQICLKLILFVIYKIMCHGSRIKFVQNMDCYTGITNLLDDGNIFCKDEWR